jgi:hypothetical protein
MILLPLGASWILRRPLALLAALLCGTVAALEAILFLPGHLPGVRHRPLGRGR